MIPLEVYYLNKCAIHVTKFVNISIENGECHRWLVVVVAAATAVAAVAAAVFRCWRFILPPMSNLFVNCWSNFDITLRDQINRNVYVYMLQQS